MISTLVHNGFLAGYLLGDQNRGSLNISHLLFANETFLFCVADQNQIRVLKTLFLCFEATSCWKDW